jgi:hypothetical protein
MKRSNMCVWMEMVVATLAVLVSMTAGALAYELE